MTAQGIAAKNILICAATRWEAEPIARALSPRKNIRVLKTGIGTERTALSLRDLPQEAASGLDAVFCAGLAGALLPGLKPGDLAADLQGAELEIIEAARETAASLGQTLHFGRILCSKTLVGSPKQKEALGRESRACAVEMESAAVLSWAQGFGVPVYHIRAILDGAGQALPPVFPEAEDLPSLFRFALKNIRHVPAFAAVGIAQRRAMKNLAAFLAAFLERI